MEAQLSHTVLPSVSPRRYRQAAPMHAHSEANTDDLSSVGIFLFDVRKQCLTRC